MRRLLLVVLAVAVFHLPLVNLQAEPETPTQEVAAQAADQPAAQPAEAAKAEEKAEAKGDEKQQEQPKEEAKPEEAKKTSKSKKADKAASEKKPAIVLLTIKGEYPETTSASGLFGEMQPSLAKLVQRMDAAAADDNVAAVWLKIENPA